MLPLSIIVIHVLSKSLLNILRMSGLMLDWYLKYDDSPLTKYLYFKVTSFSYIICVLSVQVDCVI